MPLIKLNSPIPVPLPKEVQKCTKILESFVDSSNNGLDGVIPRQVLQNARGFAIFTVFKAGFVVSARAGSGIVIARLDDGSWSAPSAIGTAGMGFGGQAGAEVTDFLVVLNSRSAVRSFMSAGSLTLGGNMSIAVGPLGRNGEASGSLNTKGKLATMYSYSKTKGLFGGVSIEGSILVERQDANAIAYDEDVTAKQLLSGVIPPPHWADPLIRALDACTGMPGGHKWVSEEPDDWIASPNPYSPSGMGAPYAFGGIGTPPLEKNRRRALSSPFGTKRSSDRDDSYFPEVPDHDFTAVSPTRPGMQRRRSLFGSKASRNSAIFNNKPLEVDGYSATDYDYGKGFDDNPDPFKSTLSRERSNSLSRFSNLSLRPRSRSSRSTPGLPRDREDEFEEDNSFLNGRKRLDSKSRDMDEWDREPAYKNRLDMDEFDPYAPSKSLFSSSTNGRRPSSNLPPPKPVDIFDEFGETEEYDDEPESEPEPEPRPGPIRLLSTKKDLKAPDLGLGKGIALYNFEAQQSGDLGFRKGDVIIITKKTTSTDDWWTGSIAGRKGMFPANYIEVV
ncbi:DUF500-domain-containing protein [Calocera cornea HHB12733]|uniref:DUF500-domain-containing protein n=1 Tax=Calocera cornea HHB12733 TaxID=1353952 RepID=A0A165DGN8_9BASI|nr:DUF500-domain-containing protein [Calocera cornea HHB12733]